MKITIITACYNSIATIRDAMVSVRRQKLPEGVELEHIVVDGGSTDGTVDRIKEYEQTHCSTSHLPPSTFRFRWLSEVDNGMYDAINKGIRMATGDVIGILNADDVLDGEDVVARIASEFWPCRGGEGEWQVVSGRLLVDSDGRQDAIVDDDFKQNAVWTGREPYHAGHNLGRHDQKEELTTNHSALNLNQLDCVYGKVRFMNELGGRTVRRCFARLWRPWMLQWGYMPPHPGVFIRRECFERWGGYVGDRKEYRIAADYELLIRFFRRHQMRAKYSGVCTTVMRTGGVSTKNVGARKLLNQEIIKANRANGYFCCWPMLLPKYAVKVWEVILPRMGLVG